ncbi:MAG TPA: DAK2 domain-containing protein [Actinomycetes bacterium]
MPATESQIAPVRGLDAAVLGDVLGAMLALIRANEAELNRLNVFPVRDHDTGTNMAATLEGVVKAVEATRGRPMAELAAAVVDAAMLEARGNSGTILAEALRGMFETWAPLELVGPAELVEGFRMAAVRAEESVLEPVEGTILTVARATADAMRQLAPADVSALLAGGADAAGRAVEATTAQLPALRRAGVVDAAARGYELCLRAFAATVAGASVGDAAAAGQAQQGPAGDGRQAAADRERGAGPSFEVQYLLACDEQGLRELEGALAAMGDSLTVARGDGRYRVHLHTDQPGAAIEEAIRRGTVSRIEIAWLGNA